MDFLGCESETQFLAFVRANYLSLFPKLCDQSQFNRRARRLRFIVEELRRRWLQHLGATDDLYLLLDTKPVPVVGYKRSKKKERFSPERRVWLLLSTSLSLLWLQVRLSDNFRRATGAL